MTARSPAPCVGLVGATSQIGRTLVPHLQAQGCRVLRISRNGAWTGSDPLHVHDASNACFVPPIEAADTLISLAPLPAIGAVLDMAGLLGARRVIAFGSTGRFSKANASSAVERDFVQQQERAEQLLSSRAKDEGIAWTLLRPTMIYGAGADQSVAFVMRMIERFGFFPLPWGARGLRQPVHVDDLAGACVAVLGEPRTHGRAYNLGGGEVLQFPELVRRVFLAAGRRPILVPVPQFPYRMLVRLGRRIPSVRFVRMEMVDRMYQDLVADNSPAQIDFGYQPRKFSPGQICP